MRIITFRCSIRQLETLFTIILVIFTSFDGVAAGHGMQSSPERLLSFALGAIDVAEMLFGVCRASLIPRVGPRCRPVWLPDGKRVVR